jgi:hypothetical protein
MVKLTAVSHSIKTTDTLLQSKNSKCGYLLITQQDEIVYANHQARQYLGLLCDEELPFGQTFLSLVTSMYQYASFSAWVDWPKSSTANSVSYLIYSSPQSNSFFQIRVEILERLLIDNFPIWVVSMSAIKSQETAVTNLIIN